MNLAPLESGKCHPEGLDQPQTDRGQKDERKTWFQISLTVEGDAGDGTPSTCGKLPHGHWNRPEMKPRKGRPGSTLGGRGGARPDLKSSWRDTHSGAPPAGAFKDSRDLPQPPGFTGTLTHAQSAPAPGALHGVPLRQIAAAFVRTSETDRLPEERVVTAKSRPPAPEPAQARTKNPARSGAGIHKCRRRWLPGSTHRPPPEGCSTNTRDASATIE